MRKTLPLIAVLVFYQAVAFLYGRPWLSDILPGGDFPGIVAAVTEIKGLVTVDWFSNWSSLRFCGSPNTIFLASLASYLYLPFMLVFEPIMATKIASLFYMGLSGASLCGMIYYFTKRWLISLWAGLAYMLSPILTISIARAGHSQMGVFYAILPIAFLALWRLTEKTCKLRLFWASLAIMVSVWIDPERALTSIPLIFAFLIIINISRNLRPLHKNWLIKSIGCTIWLGATAVLAFLFGAFFLVPEMIESQNFAFFSPDVLADSHDTFGLNNIFYLFDRGGYLVKKLSNYLPVRDCFDASNFYLGISLLVFVSTVILSHKKSDKRLGFIRAAIITITISIWAATGTSSIIQNISAQMIELYGHLSFGNDHPFLIPSIALGLVCVIGLLWWLRRVLDCPPLSPTKIALAMAFVLLVVYTPLFELLKHLPIYSHMRNPGFFMSVIPPFLLSVSAAMLLSYFLVKVKKQVFFFVMLGVTAISVFDFSHYRKHFTEHIHDQLTADYAAAFKVMKENPVQGRCLSRESYSPLTDMHTILADQDTAWYWLNWSCPKATHSIFMSQIYEQLHKPDTIENSLGLAGLFNVRFITYNLTEGPPPPPTESLRLLHKADTCAVYENTLCRDFLQFYDFEDESSALPTLEDLCKYEPFKPKVHLEKNACGNRIDIEVESDRRLLLVLSQSLYPGWKVKVDGAKNKLASIESTLPAITVGPGKHSIIFVYRRPWYFLVSFMLSLLTMAVSLKICFRNSGIISERKAQHHEVADEH